MDQGSYWQQRQRQPPEDSQWQQYYEYINQSSSQAPTAAAPAPELPPKVRLTVTDVDDGYDPFAVEHRFTTTTTTRVNSQHPPPPLPPKIPSHSFLPAPPSDNFYDSRPNFPYYGNQSFSSDSSQHVPPPNDSHHSLNPPSSTSSFDPSLPYPMDVPLIPNPQLFLPPSESHPYGRSLPQVPDYAANDLEPHHDLGTQVSKLSLDVPVSLPYPVDYDQSDIIYTQDESELTDNSFDRRSNSLNDTSYYGPSTQTWDESDSLHSPVSRSPLRGVPELSIPIPFRDDETYQNVPDPHIKYSSSPEVMKESIYPPPMRLSPRSSPSGSSRLPDSPTSLHPRRKPLPSTPWQSQQYPSLGQNEEPYYAYTGESVGESDERMSLSSSPPSPIPIKGNREHLQKWNSSPISNQRGDMNRKSVLKQTQSLLFDKSKHLKSDIPAVSEPQTMNEDYPLMVKLDLPTLPRTKSMFLASGIKKSTFAQCSEPWALSSLFQWLKIVIPSSTWTSRQEIEVALSRLFEFVIPSMSWVYSGVYATLVVDELIKARALINLDDQKQNDSRHYQLDFNNDIKVSGVLPMFTGQGCYSSQCCAYELPCYRCYSYKCCKSLHSVSPLEVQSSTHDRDIDPDWATHWHLNESDLKALNPADIKRQYAIHEVISGEESFLKDLEIWLLVFRDDLIKSKVQVLKNQKKFLDLCFKDVPDIISINQKYLLTPLKERQRSQGHFIRNIADIFLDWARHSEKILVSYATKHVYANRQMRMEREENPTFREWLERTSKDPALGGRPYAFFFSRIIPRVVRYGLLLKGVLSRMRPSDEEYPLLERAIAACNAISHKVDSAVGEAEKQTELLDLATNVEWKYPEYQTDFKMNDPHRKIIQKGKVTRRGDHRFDWVESELILLDNYLIIAKSKSGSSKCYITKPPIPLALLVLESVNDPPVVKSSSTTRLGVGTMTSAVDINRSPKATAASVPGIGADNSGKSVGGGETPAATIIEAEKDVMYPIRVSHAGRFGRSYTLYCSSETARLKWKDAILVAKKHHYSLIQSSHKEPFAMKILSHYDFRYTSSTAPHPLPFPEVGSTMDKAIKHTQFQNNTLPTYQTRVYSACRFSTSTDKEILALGCDDGIYIPSVTSWTKCIPTPNVTGIKTLNGFDSLLVLSDKNLLSYSLDAFSVMISRNKVLPRGDGPQEPAQQQRHHLHLHRHSSSSDCRPDTLIATRISGGRDVGFFVTGNLMGRSLIVYKRRENLSSMLKFIEPVTEQNLPKRRGQLGYVSSQTSPKKTGSPNNSGMLQPVEYFRQFDQLEYSGDCTNATLFNTSIGVVSKGFDITTLDCKSFRPIPEHSSISNNSDFKKKLDGAKPLAMFRISEFDFLLCYDSVAVYINNHGEIGSPPSYFNFVGQPQGIAYQHPYIIGVDSKLVEVHNVETRQICQLCLGTDFRLINSTESQIMVACAHPSLTARQVILELVRNEWNEYS